MNLLKTFVSVANECGASAATIKHLRSLSSDVDAFGNQRRVDYLVRYAIPVVMTAPEMFRALKMINPSNRDYFHHLETWREGVEFFNDRLKNGLASRNDYLMAIRHLIKMDVVLGLEWNESYPECRDVCGNAVCESLGLLLSKEEFSKMRALHNEAPIGSCAKGISGSIRDMLIILFYQLGENEFLRVAERISEI